MVVTDLGEGDFSNPSLITSLLKSQLDKDFQRLRIKSSVLTSFHEALQDSILLQLSGLSSYLFPPVTFHPSGFLCVP
jgi:hypothetical protein